LCEKNTDYSPEFDIFTPDIMAKEWFSELDLDDLRQKKYKAPFIPNNTNLETLVEKSSVHGDAVPLQGSPNFGTKPKEKNSLLDHSDSD
jgi:hypothetical protein